MHLVHPKQDHATITCTGIIHVFPLNLLKFRTLFWYIHVFECVAFMVLMQVVWKKSNVAFSHRFDKYLDPNFFQHRVRYMYSQWLCVVKNHNNGIIEAREICSSVIYSTLMNFRAQYKHTVDAYSCKRFGTIVTCIILPCVSKQTER